MVGGHSKQHDTSLTNTCAGPSGPSAPVSRTADVLFGSVAGFAGKIVEYPFDTIKVRLQTQPLGGERVYAGALDCLQKSVAAEGVAGLYRGLASPLVGSMLENAVLFVAYGQIQNMLRSLGGPLGASELSLGEKALAGAISGTCVSLVLTPVELVKCQMQASGAVPVVPTAVAASSARAAESRLAERLVLPHRVGAGRGNAHLTLFSDRALRVNANLHALFPNRQCLLGPDVLFNSAQLHYATHPTPHQRAVAAAAAAAATSAKPTVIATASPTASANIAAATSTIATFRHIVRMHGLAGLYCGNVSTVMRETAGGAAWFGTYEYARERFAARRGPDSAPTAMETMAAGALAGMAYNAALFPADVVKSRQQTFAAACARNERPPGLAATAADVYRHWGLKGFYRGFGITLVRSVPASAVIFGTYEMLKEHAGSF